MAEKIRRRMPADVPHAYKIDPRVRRAPAQIPMHAPEMYREEPARDDKKDDMYVIELN